MGLDCCFFRRSYLNTLAILVFLFVFFYPDTATAQDDSSANLAFSQAVKLNKTLDNLKGEERAKQAANILRLLELIETAYPNSLPAKRLRTGQVLAGIDVNELKKLAGGFHLDKQDSQTDTKSENFVPTFSSDEEETNSTKLFVDTHWALGIVPKAQMEESFQHGEFPSLGQRTHPGVDIIADCGSEVLAAADGEVVHLVRAGDPDYPKTGNAIIIQHDDMFGRLFLTAYFFLGATPEVPLGAVSKGSKIGKIGQSGEAQRCGMHFEVRHYFNQSSFHSEWSDLLHLGDWSRNSKFKTSWSEPSEWLNAVYTFGVLNSKEIAKDFVTFAKVRNVSIPNPTLKLKGEDEPSYFQGTTKAGGKVKLALETIEASDGYLLSFKLVFLEQAITDEETSGKKFKLSIFSRSECDDCETQGYYSRILPILYDPEFKSEPQIETVFLLPKKLLFVLDNLTVKLMDGNEEVYAKLEDSYLVEAPVGMRLSQQEAETTLKRFLQCTAIKLDSGSTLNLRLAFDENQQIVYEKSLVTGSEGLTKTEEYVVRTSILAKVKKCTTKDFSIPPITMAEPLDLEIVIEGESP